MKITIEVNGFRLVVNQTDLKDIGFCLPRDVHTDIDGQKTLGQSHISFSGTFREGFQPEWEEVAD